MYLISRAFYSRSRTSSRRFHATLRHGAYTKASGWWRGRELLKKEVHACNDVSKPLDETMVRWRRHIYWIFRKLSERNSPVPAPPHGVSGRRKWIKGLLHACRSSKVGGGEGGEGAYTAKDKKYIYIKRCMYVHIYMQTCVLVNSRVWHSTGCDKQDYFPERENKYRGPDGNPKKFTIVRINLSTKELKIKKKYKCLFIPCVRFLSIRRAAVVKYSFWNILRFKTFILR